MLKPKYNKLKTNLKLIIQRLKIMEKKKTENALKARREIAGYIASNKIDRAKIRVESIIREDYLVEALEMIETYCDLLLTRFGLIEQMKNLDEGLAEAVSSIIWATPRITDAQELKVIVYLLTKKYGKQYVKAVQEGEINTINENLKRKMIITELPKIMIERYLIEIAKNQNVPYTPDIEVMLKDEIHLADNNLADKKPLIDLGPGPVSPPPTAPLVNQNLSQFESCPELESSYIDSLLIPSSSLDVQGAKVGSFPTIHPFDFDLAKPTSPTTPNINQINVNFPETPDDYLNLAPNFQPNATSDNNLLVKTESPLAPNYDPPNYHSVFPDTNHSTIHENTPIDNQSSLRPPPPPAPRKSKMPSNDDQSELHDLPVVPNNELPNFDGDVRADNLKNDAIDFDDLAARFEALKKKK